MHIGCDCNWTRTHNHLVCKQTLNDWVFVYELSGCEFESSCSHLKFRFRACFEQGVPWHSGNYRMWIHSEMRMWHENNIQLHRLCIKRKEGDRRPISIEECVEDAIAGFDHYVQNSQEKLVSAAWRSSKEQEVTEPPKITKQRRQTKRKQDWKNKRLRRQFIRDTEDIADIKSWYWLRNCHYSLKK